jgi:glucokinase-like ROK family protein
MQSPDIRAFIKRRNVVSILKALFKTPLVSRAELARRTDMTSATVSSLVARLVDLGLLESVGEGESTGGRKPVLVRFRPDAFYLAGVDVGLAKVIVVVTNLHGSVVARRRIELSSQESKESMVGAISDVVGDLFREEPGIASLVQAIGVSYPGLVSPEEGVVLNTPNRPFLNGIPLARILRNTAEVPVFLENDGMCMTLGQVRFGDGVGAQNVVGLLLGDGVGGGLIVNGEPYRGHGTHTAEFGHITVSPTGPICGCGNQGCLEVTAGALAVAENARRTVLAGRGQTMLELAGGKVTEISARVVDEAARMGDPTALDLMLQAGWFIGMALADVVNMLDPDLVVVGGGMSRAGDYFRTRIREVVHDRSYVYKVERDPLPLTVAAFGDAANAVGAAAVAMEQLLVTT